MKSFKEPVTHEEFSRIRAGFIAQGASFSGWCKLHQVTPSNAKAALVGSWNGPKAKELRTKIIAASGIDQLD
ncbi:hypothetical protein [Vibrio quintilis]|uniref:Phage-associated protein, BcepMu gp16 family n=1 Tax=Vibrio quintilis TaxID=1117707 RepID=A0A1M7YQW8_9VIBR|nr:hypothetical protein [Vibrio quintilis]SHO55009.1 hypothetical protein VQ7734_00728 [Vibrio quintilis]